MKQRENNILAHSRIHQAFSQVCCQLASDTQGIKNKEQHNEGPVSCIELLHVLSYVVPLLK